MQSCFSSSELLLERLEERKYCLQEIISNYLKSNQFCKSQLSDSTLKVVEQLEKYSCEEDQRSVATFCIPSESILFIPKEPWEESNSQAGTVGRNVKAFQVRKVELSSSFLVIAGMDWVSFWLLPFRDEPGKLPRCDNLKWLPNHLEILNLVFSQDESFLLVQACNKLEYTTWESAQLIEESCSITLHNMLFSLKDYSLLKSFSFSFPVQYLKQERKLWSALLSSCQEGSLYLYTIGDKGSLYFVDLMEETLFLRRLSSEGVKFIFINRIYLEGQMDKCFVFGLSDNGEMVLYPSTKLSFGFSNLKGIELDWIIPHRLYVLSTERDTQTREYSLDICQNHFALGYVFVEWDAVFKCYRVHFMIQSSETSVKVHSISLEFLEDKKLESWNLSNDKTSLLCLNTVDGMVILIDMEHCRYIGNILLTREEKTSLVAFRSFDNRAVAVWKSCSGLINLWEDLHIYPSIIG